MARKNIVQLTLRFRLNDEKERRLFKIVDDVDKNIYKSKNKFIMDALDAYINGTGKSLHEDAETGIYVTESQLKEKLEKMRNEIRVELYQELVVFLAKSGVTAALINANAVQSINEVPSPVGVIQESKQDENDIPAEMLADIEKWS